MIKKSNKIIRVKGLQSSFDEAGITADKTATRNTQIYYGWSDNMKITKPAASPLKPSPDDLVKDTLFPVHGDEFYHQHCTTIKNNYTRRLKKLVFEKRCLNGSLKAVLMRFHSGFMMVCIMVLRR